MCVRLEGPLDQTMAGFLHYSVPETRFQSFILIGDPKACSLSENIPRIPTRLENEKRRFKIILHKNTPRLIEFK